MTTLSEEIRRLAEEMAGEITAGNEITPVANGIESAILAGMKLVLEREPSDKLISETMHCLDGINLKDHGKTAGEQKYYKYVTRYRAMTRELLKELTEEDRNAETKRSTA